MLCVPIGATSNEEMLRDAARAAEVADLVEMRLDAMAEAPDLARLLAARACPVIVTNRPAWEGGQYHGPEERRMELLQQAMDLGAEYVDVELKAAAKLRRRGNTKVIVSYHNFEETPPHLERIHGDLVAAGADVAKVAVMARDIFDNLPMFDLLRRARVPTIGLCMGEAGRISRILAPKFRGYLTFASLEEGRESAPGQMRVDEMRGLYRYHDIGPGTDVYGVVANPVAHSMSPAIHNASFAAVGVDAVYVPFKVADVVRFLRAFRGIGVKGYSVTIPHKVRAIEAMDEVDESVRNVGALNTVIDVDGRLCGFNTDLTGAVRALEDAMHAQARHGPEPGAAPGREAESPLKGWRVALLGAGGAARAVAFGLKSRGADVTIVNRTYERGRKLAADVGCACRPRQALGAIDYDCLVNTTSVGMSPNVDQTPAPREALRPGAIVFDAVYNPLETRLLREAAEAGCRTVPGLAWFVNQAADQFELWTGRQAPTDVMEGVLRQRLSAAGG